MSLFPPTDLIVDVGHAADPSRRAQAYQRLERLLPSGSKDEFVSSLHSDTTTASNITTPLSTSKSSVPVSLNPVHSVNSDGVSAFKEFEAFLLQTWLETLLPKIDGGAYGHDNASGVWRSLMAEQLGEQLAGSDCIGIGRLIDHGNKTFKESESPKRIEINVQDNIS